LYNMVAMDLWDDEARFELAAGQVWLARMNGTLGGFRSRWTISPRFNQAGGHSALRAAAAGRVARGRAGATGLTEVIVRGASARGEGAALTSAECAKAVLFNSIGNYGFAAEAAHGASAVDELVISPWALYELAEAAVRSGQRERATAAADRLWE
jgi:hypothetical protein